MGISLSGGPWQYNRFSSLDEGSKPDYLDFDKDGDEKEPMKKALKEKGKKPCPKCEDKKSPCECHDTVKEWVESLLEEGYDLSEYSWDEMVELFDEGWVPIDKEKQQKIDRQIGRAADKEAIEKGKSKKYGRDEKKIEKQYQRQQAMRFGKKMKKEEFEQLDEISQKTKMKAYAASRDVDADYSYGDKVHEQGNRIKAKIVKDHGEKAGEHAEAHADARNFGRGTPRAKERIEPNRKYRTTKSGKMHGQDQKKLKSDLKKKRTHKEEVEAYLVSEGFASNPVSAEVLFNHMSEDWLEAIEKSFG